MVAFTESFTNYKKQYTSLKLLFKGNNKISEETQRTCIENLLSTLS